MNRLCIYFLSLMLMGCGVSQESASEIHDVVGDGSGMSEVSVVLPFSWSLQKIFSSATKRTLCAGLGPVPELGKNGFLLWFSDTGVCSPGRIRDYEFASFRWLSRATDPGLIGAKSVYFIEKHGRTIGQFDDLVSFGRPQYVTSLCTGLRSSMCTLDLSGAKPVIR